MENRTITETFSQTAEWCADTVSQVPSSAWSAHGLGEWDLRALVGHTSRALSTVTRAITTPAATIELESAEAYFQTASLISGTDPNAVRDRGIAAGDELGDDPATQFRTVLEAALASIRSVDNPIVTSVAGAMTLSQYLRTRVFELVVHGLDIQTALTPTSLDAITPPPEAALREALTITQNLAILRGDGQQLLFTLTGRKSLPANYSVLA
ncbi:maleylpyruvate isomerase family protein [Leucobacter coleopterorum]|uniref:Maleylpyruvate isomerase family protein n=1 Tax=Leucobacter coleopterorum TaxID=2714933 RepID=A0ABX6K0I8_9MICO|nr:maleylpyruvate isomerase N-terminal domain-containing protein [Leucobacter coleopterorum]QIM18560.1 maleylpyruvate isomerase family protein [Leucobacter coleopterorum]